MTFDKNVGVALGGILTSVLLIAIMAPRFPNLKDWQPLIAACVALFGGFLAYQGAMAKISFDKEQDAKRSDREKTGILLRTQNAMVTIVAFAEANLDTIKGFHDKFPVGEFNSGLEIDLADAWGALHLFPIKEARNVVNLRTNVAAFKQVIENNPKEILDTRGITQTNKILRDILTEAKEVYAFIQTTLG